MIYRIWSILVSRLFVHGILICSCLILSVRHWITRPAAKASSALSETSIAWSFILTEAPSRPISERYRYGFKSMICPMLGLSLSLVKNMDIHLTTQNLPSLGGTPRRSCTRRVFLTTFPRYWCHRFRICGTWSSILGWGLAFGYWLKHSNRVANRFQHHRWPGSGDHMLPEQSSNLCFVARVFQTLRAGLLLTRVWSLSMLLVTLEMKGHCTCLPAAWKRSNWSSSCATELHVFYTNMAGSPLYPAQYPSLSRLSMSLGACIANQSMQ